MLQYLKKRFFDYGRKNMIQELIKNIKEKDAPIVVGLDPMLGYVPEHIVKDAFAAYGENLAGAAEAIWQFNKGIIDATYDLIPAVKPQIAMYEQFGLEGLKAFKRTCDYAKSKGLVTTLLFSDGNGGYYGMATFPKEHKDVVIPKEDVIRIYRKVIMFRY